LKLREETGKGDGVKFRKARAKWSYSEMRIKIGDEEREEKRKRAGFGGD